MTVTLNESAVRLLLETEDGPLGRFIQRKAEQITAQAQQNVRDYFVSAPSLDVDQDVDFSMQGSTATIGIRDAGSKSRRLAKSQSEGKVNWLLKSLEAGR